MRQVVAEKIRYEVLMDATRRFDRALLADAPQKDLEGRYEARSSMLLLPREWLSEAGSSPSAHISSQSIWRSICSTRSVA